MISFADPSQYPQQKLGMQMVRWSFRRSVVAADMWIVDCAIWIVDTKVCWRTMLDTVVGPILSPIRPSRPPSTCHPHLPQDTRQDQHCTSSSVFHLRPRIWSVWEFTSKIIVGDAAAATAPGICVEWLRLSRWQYNTPSASTAGWSTYKEGSTLKGGEAHIVAAWLIRGALGELTPTLFSKRLN